VNFSPRITQIALIFFIFSREFALFAVNFNSTMRNPKEPLFFLRVLCVSVVRKTDDEMFPPKY